MLIWTNFESFTNTYPNIGSLLQKFHFPLEIVFNFFVNTKGPGTSFQVKVFVEYFVNFFFYDVTQTDQISLRYCVYFPSYSAKFISWFILRHLMT